MNISRKNVRPYSAVIGRLKQVGLRPTRQRVALANLLLEGDDRHVTAEELHAEARKAGVSVSLATVYNALHQFTKVGLMREVVVKAGRSYFDTNTNDHHHFYHENSEILTDIPIDKIELSKLPMMPKGKRLRRIEITVRVVDEVRKNSSFE